MDDRTYIIYKELEKPTICRFLYIVKGKFPRPSCVSIFVCIALLTILLLFPFLQKESPKNVHIEHCKDHCSFTLVESIPEGINFNSTLHSNLTYDVWKKLIDDSKKNICIASSYWTLRSSNVFNDNSSWEGQSIFDSLYDASLNRAIDLRIVQNYARETPDTSILAQAANAKVRKLDFRKFSNYGILHTKLWIFDDTHFYIGSANMDWRSLTQVKEVGVLARDCACLARDVRKIFESYWLVSASRELPLATNNQENLLTRNQATILPPWPDNMTASYNVTQPAVISSIDGTMYNVYISSSPPILNGKDRSNDIDGILDVINNAQKYVHISVMEYMPGTLYLPSFQYWPIIDNALREAALNRGIKIRMLISWWEHSNPKTLHFLKSLYELTFTGLADIQIRILVIPSFNDKQKKIPYARVNHNKIMVTDSAAYIGTSNWSADYFLWTGGVGIIIKPLINGTTQNYENLHVTDDFRSQLEQLFDRDWSSDLTIDLYNFTIPKNFAFSSNNF
ncbi:unnamed protein product [Gordionus sp. m RMFG-2023]|uniref:5'-3' exonuclease PLD3-like n=1 Tax=Gordionus sp. m RMFG-2023 TaxID=3053472 RepID=UPI0030E1D00F